VERVRSLGILYDRSATGEYFHIYTTTFAERFFFEIVQRGGRYDGYGALNAPHGWPRRHRRVRANETRKNHR
jgi:4-hydroxyphenylpyruvate dioxygenase